LTSGCKAFTVARMAKRIFQTIGRWKWALLYAAFILAMLPVTPALFRSLDDVVLPSFVGPLLVAIALGSWILLVVYAVRARSENRTLRALLLTMVGFVYAAVIIFMLHFPVERLHLVEYGLLGALAWGATSGEGRIPLRALRVVVFVSAVGFLDEVLQGVISGRYYDNRDLIVNMVAGFLGAAVVCLAGRGEASHRAAFGQIAQRRPAANLNTALVMAAVAFGAVGVGRPPCDEGALAGTWERTGECGLREEVTFDGTGSWTWQDEAGNGARGHYVIEGNRLDGPLLGIVCKWAENQSECGFQPEFTANVYITIEGDRFFFNDAPDLPMIRRKTASIHSVHSPQGFDQSLDPYNLAPGQLHTVQ
jgi:VanZ family protein